LVYKKAIMASPTASIYTYRVKEVDVRKTPSEGYFVAEYSSDGGTTWLPVFPWTFQSLNEAMGEIANTVSEEEQFRTKVESNLAPFVTITAYPGNPE
jgi:hypothetical protein